MRYDESKLEKWVARIPKCREFLVNFFISCREDPVSAFVNYANDVKSYSGNYRFIKDNSAFLLKAFEDIAGIRIYFG